MNKQIRLLLPSEIDIKIKKVTEKGAVALLYKTARVDMEILDETFGADKWETDYRDIKGVLFCGIGVHTDNGVVWKWSNGIESRADDEGNEKKGEASDAFKRAGVMWGIGRELYTAPFIFLRLPVKKDGNRYKLKNPYEEFFVKSIEYYESERRIKSLVIVDEKGKVVYPNFNEQEYTPEKMPELTDEQEDLLAKYGIDLNKVASYFNVPRANLTSEQIDEAIRLKEAELSRLAKEEMEI